MTFPYEEAGVPFDGEDAGSNPDVTAPTEAETFSTEMAEADAGTPTTEVATEVPTFNVDEYADHVVTVKVDGEDIQVPLKEALNGYMRQADYTRKTQSAAELRREAEAFRAFRDAFQKNPQGVLQALQQNLPMAGNVGVTPQPTVGIDPNYYGQQVVPDPIEQRLAAIERHYQDQLLAAELQRLQSTYPDFNPDEVVSEAVRRGVTNIYEVEAVYKSMAFDRLYAQQQAQQEFANRQAQEAAARAAAAEAATQAISDAGGGVTAGASAPTSYGSLAEAFAAAEAETGFVWGD